MTKEDKLNIDLDIMNAVNKLVDIENMLDAVLYIRGDAEYQTASVNMKGDARLMANVIQHHVDKNEEFRRFIFAAIGAYISKNPAREQEFNAGVNLMKQQLGLN